MNVGRRRDGVEEGWGTEGIMNVRKDNRMGFIEVRKRSSGEKEG